jgi:outer membrane protein OmpA-like peptidoglycan-associated protein
MKKIIFLSAILFTAAVAGGQIFQKVAGKIKNRVESNANNKADSTINKNVDEAMNGGGGGKKGNSNDHNKAEVNSNGNNQQGSASIKSYSRYDFVPGEKIIVFEDFAQDAVGDFPDKWNTNASAEIVTIESLPGKWLKINRQGVFMPDFIDSLQENFTLEYDLLCDNPGKVWTFYTTLAALSDRKLPEGWQSASSRFTFTVAAYPDGNSTSSIERSKDGASESTGSTGTKQFSDKSNPVHVAIWRQKERLRVYFNQEKVWDLPKVMSQTASYNALVYWMQGPSDNGNFYLSNLRLAVGIPDTRKKILEQNKWVTHGILFDVNSATIKPESYGTLKEMANVLKEFADIKVKIIGHTDADGSDAANSDLSKRRAAAVKEMLVKEFGIDENRMQTDGKGESEPIDKNDSPAGKANNRRVEFIKI